MKKIILILITCLLFGGMNQVQATVFSTNNFTNGKTSLSFWSNHGYYPRSNNFKYAYEIFAFEYLRQDLVNDGAIEDIPVLIEIPTPISADFPEKSSIEINENCVLYSGEDGMYQKDLGQCYKLTMTNDGYENIILAIMHLQNISKSDQIDIADFKKLDEMFKDDLNNYDDLTNDFDPVWSPESKYVTYINWQGGKNTVKVFNSGDKIQVFSQELSDYQMYRALWSPDSKYLLYATNDAITIFNLEDKNVKKLDLTRLTENLTMQVMMQIEGFAVNNFLFFAIEKDYFGGYLVYRYDLVKDELTWLNENQPDYDYSSIYDYKLELAEVTNVGVASPDNQYVASVKHKDGLKVFSLETNSQLDVNDVVQEGAIAVAENKQKDNSENQISSQDNNLVKDVFVFYYVIVALAILIVALILFIIFRKK